MNSGSVFLACFFVFLATVILLLRRYGWTWTKKGLHRGDLQALGEIIANRKRYGVGRDRILRLTQRGFAVQDGWGGCRATLKGRYAALVSLTRRNRDISKA